MIVSICKMHTNEINIKNRVHSYKEHKLYQLVDQFSERKINHSDFYSTLLDYIHLFYDGNGRTCVILFVRIFI